MTKQQQNHAELLLCQYTISKDTESLKKLLVYLNPAFFFPEFNSQQIIDKYTLSVAKQIEIQFENGVVCIYIVTLKNVVFILLLSKNQIALFDCFEYSAEKVNECFNKFDSFAPKKGLLI